VTVQAFDQAPLTDVQFEVFTEESSPRAVIILDGVRYVPNSVELTKNAHGATDSGTITLPISINPDFSIQLFRGSSSPGQGGVEAFKNAPIDDSPVEVEVFFGFPGNPAPLSTDISQLSRVFYGVVDQYSASWTNDSVSFAIRSWAAPLVDNDITTLVMNQTTEQFVQQTAKQFGLQAKVYLGQPPLTVQEVLSREFIGGSNFATSIHKMKYWDVLLQCAQFDDVDVWVDDDTLYYAAPDLIPRNTIRVNFGRDISLNDSATGTHSPQFSKNIQVEVRSCQPRLRISHVTRVKTNASGGIDVTHVNKTISSSPVFGTPNSVTQTINADGSTSTNTSTTPAGGTFNTGFTGPGKESGKERYIYYRPNISQQASVQLAKALWRQISQHEYAQSFTMPITKKNFGPLGITSLLQIDGCPYAFFNDRYWPRKITWRFSADEAPSWDIEALNHRLPQGSV
jgi:hypothetical protein